MRRRKREKLNTNLLANSLTRGTMHEEAYETEHNLLANSLNRGTMHEEANKHDGVRLSIKYNNRFIVFTLLHGSFTDDLAAAQLIRFV